MGSRLLTQTPNHCDVIAQKMAGITSFGLKEKMYLASEMGALMADVEYVERMGERERCAALADKLGNAALAEAIRKQEAFPG
jgi:hypothetical protein